MSHVHLYSLVHLGESSMAGQRKMILVSLCYGDLTQGLPDFTVHDTCPWPLSPSGGGARGGENAPPAGLKNGGATVHKGRLKTESL